MQRNIHYLYQDWLDNVEDESLQAELASFSTDEKKLEDAFFRDLQFGTGGLRGILGAGPNRMNRYTVGKATTGLASYIKQVYGMDAKVAIAYDTRNMSQSFAEIVAAIFASYGLHAYLYRETMPTPCLSYAVRALRCQVGVMITASHNPAEYNGYKVYGEDGCQITTELAKAITDAIGKIDIFKDVPAYDFSSALTEKNVSYIDDSVYQAYLEEVQDASFAGEEERSQYDSLILYSPLHGAGYVPVTDALRLLGYTNVQIVEEQKYPDGNFPTAPYPNPEEKEAMSMGLQQAQEIGADLFFATDPDCDRLGVAARDDNGDLQLLSGNQLGCLLLDYLCQRRLDNKKLHPNSIFIKTIVTTELAKAIATSYGLETIDVLTGFKYIGEQIGHLENQGEENRFVFAFEESCGYLSAPYVRDKDAVNASVITADMYCFYKHKGISLFQRLKEIYSEHGYSLEKLHVYTFAGAEGAKKMQSIMDTFRSAEETEIAGYKLLAKEDFLAGLKAFPKSDVLRYFLDENVSFVLRPSGTEPKLKLYNFVRAENETSARVKEEQLVEYIEEYINTL